MMLRADCGLRVTTVDMRVLPALHRLGLISRSADGRMAVSEGGKVHLSHLGLEVRAFLKDQEQ
jgi:ribosomal protein S19E (S16A)